MLRRCKRRRDPAIVHVWELTFSTTMFVYDLQDQRGNDENGMEDGGDNDTTVEANAAPAVVPMDVD